MAGASRPASSDPRPRPALLSSSDGACGPCDSGVDPLNAPEDSTSGEQAPTPDIAPKALDAEKARLARYIESIEKHRRALDVAIEENFGGHLDPAEWREAFDSPDPRDANRTMVVTGDHSAVLNAYVEVLRTSAGARLIGLLPHRRPHAEQVFTAVQADSGLSDEQATLLDRLYVLEGRLEHASPDVQAEEVRDAVEDLREALPELLRAALAWLTRHGIELK